MNFNIFLGVEIQAICMQLVKFLHVGFSCAGNSPVAIRQENPAQQFHQP